MRGERPRTRLLCGLVRTARHTEGGQRTGSREPRTGCTIGTAEPLPEQGRPRRARQGPRQLPGVRSGRGLARQIRRFLEDRTSSRRQLHRAPERTQRGCGGPRGELEQPSDRLQARDDVALEGLGQRHIERAQSGLVRSAPPCDQRSHFGSRRTACSLEPALRLVEITLVPGEPRPRRARPSAWMGPDR